MENTEWYSNKDLFEQIQNFKQEFINLTRELTKEMYSIREEMKETKLLIREYNGLRYDIEETKKNLNSLEEDIELQITECKKKIDDIEKQLDRAFTSLKTLKWVGGTAVTILSVVIQALLKLFGKG